MSGGEISAEGGVGVEQLEVLLEELVDLRGELRGHGGGGRWCGGRRPRGDWEGEGVIVIGMGMVMVMVTVTSRTRHTAVVL